MHLARPDPRQCRAGASAAPYAPRRAALPALLLGLLLAAVWLALPAAGTASDFESPPVMNAAQVLPPALAASAWHRVQPRVSNDGFMNRYRIDSRFGSLEADSTAELRKRVAELAAVARLDALVHSDAFAAHLRSGSAGEEVAGGPVGAMLSGVGRMLEGAGRALTGPGGTEADPRVFLAGVHRHRHQYASALGVDVYSRNPVLRTHLLDVARAAQVGGVEASSVGDRLAPAEPYRMDAAELLGEADRLLPPGALRRANRERLLALGVSEEMADLFLDAGHFTPTQRGLLLDALERTDVADHRAEFVAAALRTDGAQVADFRRRQAQMYAAIDAQHARVGLYVMVGQIPAAITEQGMLYLALPVDHLFWTAAISSLELAASRIADEATGGNARHLWLAGRASARAMQRLRARGWTVHSDTAGSADRRPR